MLGIPPSSTLERSCYRCKLTPYVRMGFLHVINLSSLVSFVRKYNGSRRIVALFPCGAELHGPPLGAGAMPRDEEMHVELQKQFVMNALGVRTGFAPSDFRTFCLPIAVLSVIRLLQRPAGIIDETGRVLGASLATLVTLTC